MTNREKMNTVSNREVGILTHLLYFNPSKWVKGTYAQQHSTPSELKVATWLDESADDYTELWNEVHDADTEWGYYQQKHPEGYAEMASNSDKNG